MAAAGRFLGGMKSCGCFLVDCGGVVGERCGSEIMVVVVLQ